MSLGEQLEIDCQIEAFPKANSYWSKKPQIHRSDATRLWSQQQQQLTYDGDRRALFHKPKQQQLHQMLQDDMVVDSSSGIMNSSSLPLALVDGENEMSFIDGDLVVGQQAGLSDKQANNNNHQLMTAQFSSNHPHNRIQLRQVRRLLHGRYRRQVGDDESTVTLDTSSYQRPAPIVEPLAGSAGAESTTSSPGQSSSTKAYVTVKQTAINAYTYNLRLTIARMQPDDYGEYSCISTNSMGISESHVIVTSKCAALTTTTTHFILYYITCLIVTHSSINQEQIEQSTEVT